MKYFGRAKGMHMLETREVGCFRCLFYAGCVINVIVNNVMCNSFSTLKKKCQRL